MKTTRNAVVLVSALLLAAGCGMKGPLVLPEADTANNGSAQPTGGTSRPPAAERIDAVTPTEAAPRVDSSGDE
ncbi:LPS translocon maturation chaperone LptM [Arenimonas composti]|uniref:Lipoprotein n=1 Tax=Arenimonas composti TR7-09 = DSM 18010 TaxID=1121013 RepID=A0A091BDK4_9GAMM|nr:lipoprotein [Arenimonas composti]KFN49826.1 hypothetical protein P873_08880 [Arenimonas composti TR7-09 = DSM 18010]